jgi:hypothetical protein
MINRARTSRNAAAITLAAGLASIAHAQQSTVFSDWTGASVSSLSTNPPDLVRTSTARILPSSGYTFRFNPTVRGTGFLGTLVIPNPTPLGEVVNLFIPGQSRLTFGAVRNTPGTIPAQLSREVLDGTFSGITVSLTFDHQILSDGRCQTGIRNIRKPFGLGLEFTTGGATFEAVSLPAPVVSEWHFDGTLLSVRESGLDTTAGPGKLRYLDDPAFGAILGGPGETTSLPATPTPQDITRQQSAFGTTSSFGIPALPGTGGDDTVYRVSPPRNLADPTNRAKSRGIGLALFPNTADTFPDERTGQWTIVWDLYIPATSWTGEFACTLLEDNHNNDDAADMFIRRVAGVARVGYQTDFATDTVIPQIQPGRWFRLALSSDGYRAKTGRLFIDGVFAGVTGGDWTYNAVKSTDPRYGDKSSTNPLGTPVSTADWNAWGRFPSPWAVSPNATAAPLASTICLFADLQGRGETFYVANMLFTDEAMSDAQIAALGTASGRGIRYLKPAACGADFNSDGFVDFFDFDDFVACFEGSACPPGASADFNQDGFADFFDFDDFVLAFETGC